MNKEYFDTKRKKIEDKFQVIKDKTLQKYLDATREFTQSQQELTEELTELNNLEKENTMEEETKEVVATETPTEQVEATPETTHVESTVVEDAPTAE